MKSPIQRLSGFTLIEISLILAVLGLLVGTIIGARAMLRNRQLGMVQTEATKLHTATQQFRLKYGYLPGDMPNASEIWSSASNGTGNGLIGVSGSPVAGEASEWLYAVQHLSFAKLIEGSFSGALNPGVSTPAGPLPLTGYSFTTDGLANSEALSDTTLYDGNYTAALYFGLLNSGGGGAPSRLWAPTISGEDAWLLDSKFDDQYPATGHTRTYISTAPNSVTTTCTSAGGAPINYDRSLKNPSCALIFLNAAHLQYIGAQ
jgi:hypothetical protein